MKLSLENVEKNQLSKQVFKLTLTGFIVGILISYYINSSLNFSIILTSLFTIVGFFVSATIQFAKLNHQQPPRAGRIEDFDWGVEINLRRLQLDFGKSSSMLQFAGFLAGSSLIAMSFLINSFSEWTIAHQIFFPVFVILFLTFSHFALRWWFAIRLGSLYLKERKERR